MPRWTEDAPGRLQRAAIELFLERGYDEVTVAQIADRAGLTRRSFFNHFADKREIFFVGAAAFQTQVVDHLAAAPADRDPFQAATDALTTAGNQFADIAGDAAVPVRSLIAASAELRERERTKMAAVTQAITETLTQRGSTARVADLTARAAVTVFTVAFNQWVDHHGVQLATLVHEVATDLRDTLNISTPGQAHPPSTSSKITAE